VFNSTDFKASRVACNVHEEVEYRVAYRWPSNCDSTEEDGFETIEATRPMHIGREVPVYPDLERIDD